MLCLNDWNPAKMQGQRSLPVFAPLSIEISYTFIRLRLTLPTAVGGFTRGVL
ncbi:hypothetical protein JOY44_16070 [Phormidium sp. CLA17]|uniref:hypothetical protein n=1 Tax=Leptolyngbya sp. Cla-17 TaxID=2803751 RepID=UPI0019325AC3|nr:hypothetical protein [Leptolyngbya sp. Cla-17]MBM0743105.1 hypothetical protein [Leptolyngbya sp. Cla-17]